jgi:Glycosyl transferases group 1
MTTRPVLPWVTSNRDLTDMAPPSFQVITYGWERHAGLRHDAELLQQALSVLGHTATVLNRASYRTLSWRIMMSRKAHALRADRVVRSGLGVLFTSQRRIRRQPQRVMLHVQYPSPRHLINGATQIFVPNPEWFWDRDAWALPLVDVVLCKTRHAVPVFASAGCAVEYVGFTSVDCHVPGISPDRSRWLHIASNGHQKGTAEIVEAWHRHSNWPHLTVVASKRTAPTPPARNLEVIDEWLGEAELRTLMQRCGVHLCPSNAEGFGHTIVEAMSCGVLVLTTDLEPMNELVDESSGMLVDVAETTPMGWARRAKFSQDALEATVERAIGLPDADYARRAAAARDRYLHNDIAFRQRLGALATRLTAPAGADPL